MHLLEALRGFMTEVARLPLLGERLDLFDL